MIEHIPYPLYKYMMWKYNQDEDNLQDLHEVTSIGNTNEPHSLCVRSAFHMYICLFPPHRPEKWIVLHDKYAASVE